MKLDDLLKTKVGSSPANQHLRALGAVENHQRERHPLSTLVQESNGQHQRKTSVGICITLVSFRHKELDDDNLSTGFKPLRDAIATSLGVDDADKRLLWEVRQVVTKGAEGTQVLMSTFQPTTTR